MALNLPLLYFVGTEEYCQTSPNKNKSPNLWYVTSIIVCCIFGELREGFEWNQISLDNPGGTSDSLKIYLASFRTLRGRLFHKQETDGELFCKHGILKRFYKNLAAATRSHIWICVDYHTMGPKFFWSCSWHSVLNISCVVILQVKDGM